MFWNIGILKLGEFFGKIITLIKSKKLGDQKSWFWYNFFVIFLGAKWPRAASLSSVTGSKCSCTGLGSQVSYNKKYKSSWGENVLIIDPATMYRSPCKYIRRC